MNRSTIERSEIIDIVATWAASEPLVRTAFLYGSVARNESEPSDVDVAIRLNPESGDAHENSGWGFESPGLRDRLQDLLPLQVQLELYDPNDVSDIVRSGIDADGIVVYDHEET